VCSGEGQIVLANTAGTYTVSSKPTSTIDVRVYDGNGQANAKTIAPGTQVNIAVTSVLFLLPDESHSGTAEGQYWLS
jgi:hypothetical protein